MRRGDRDAAITVTDLVARHLLDELELQRGLVDYLDELGRQRQPLWRGRAGLGG